MAKILHIHFAGPVDQSDPDPTTVQIKCICKIVETSQPVRTITIYPQTLLKDTLGVLKLPIILNTDLRDEVVVYLARIYGEIGFDNIFISGAY